MNYFYDKTKAIFFGEDILLTDTTSDATVWGKIWNALIPVDNNVFVLQATQKY